MNVVIQKVENNPAGGGFVVTVDDGTTYVVANKEELSRELKLTQERASDFEALKAMVGTTIKL